MPPTVQQFLGYIKTHFKDYDTQGAYLRPGADEKLNHIEMQNAYNDFCKKELGLAFSPIEDLSRNPIFNQSGKPALNEALAVNYINTVITFGGTDLISKTDLDKADTFTAAFGHFFEADVLAKSDEIAKAFQTPEVQFLSHLQKAKTKTTQHDPNIAEPLRSYDQVITAYKDFCKLNNIADFQETQWLHASPKTREKIIELLDETRTLFKEALKTVSKTELERDAASQNLLYKFYVSQNDLNAISPENFYSAMKPFFEPAFIQKFQALHEQINQLAQKDRDYQSTQNALNGDEPKKTYKPSKIKGQDHPSNTNAKTPKPDKNSVGIPIDYITDHYETLQNELNSNPALKADYAKMAQSVFPPFANIPESGTTYSDFGSAYGFPHTKPLLEGVFDANQNGRITQDEIITTLYVADGLYGNNTGLFSLEEALSLDRLGEKQGLYHLADMAKLSPKKRSQLKNMIQNEAYQSTHFNMLRKPLAATAIDKTHALAQTTIVDQQKILASFNAEAEKPKSKMMTAWANAFLATRNIPILGQENNRPASTWLQTQQAKTLTSTPCEEKAAVLTTQYAFNPSTTRVIKTHKTEKTVILPQLACPTTVNLTADQQAQIQQVLEALQSDLGNLIKRDLLAFNYEAAYDAKTGVQDKIKLLQLGKVLGELKTILNQPFQANSITLKMPTSIDPLNTVSGEFNEKNKTLTIYPGILFHNGQVEAANASNGKTLSNSDQPSALQINIAKQLAKTLIHELQHGEQHRFVTNLSQNKTAQKRVSPEDQHRAQHYLQDFKYYASRRTIETLTGDPEALKRYAAQLTEQEANVVADLIVEAWFDNKPKLSPEENPGTKITPVLQVSEVKK